MSDQTAKAKSNFLESKKPNCSKKFLLTSKIPTIHVEENFSSQAQDVSTNVTCNERIQHKKCLKIAEKFLFLI